MTETRDDWLDFWERRELRFVVAISYVLLALSTALDIGVRGGVGPGMRVDLALAVATALLMVALDVRRRPVQWISRSWEAAELRAPIASALTFALLIALMATLVVRSPIYGFFTFTGYFWSFRLLPGRARMAGVALTAAMSAISQTGSFPYHGGGRIGSLVVVYVINAGVAGSVTWFGFVSDAQQRRRAEKISALTQANAKLEAAIARNEELQEQLLDQARETGIAQERRRMAREIHDTLAQGLAGIVTQLQAAKAAGWAGADSAAGHVDSAIDLARDSLAEARRSVQALTPEPLVGARLPDAIGDVADRWSQRTGIPVAVTTTGDARAVGTEIEVALLRTAQEALANVAKHARATRVGLTLSYMEDLVTLDVRDDGVGFVCPPAAASPAPVGADGGFGLTAMRQRVEGAAGVLQIESEPDAGTAVSASIPVQALA
jgi:signal transduction histidine kinase